MNRREGFLLVNKKGKLVVEYHGSGSYIKRLMRHDLVLTVFECFAIGGIICGIIARFLFRILAAVEQFTPYLYRQYLAGEDEGGTLWRVRDALIANIGKNER